MRKPLIATCIVVFISVVPVKVSALFEFTPEPSPLSDLAVFLKANGDWTPFYIPSGRYQAGTVITRSGQSLKLDRSSCFPKLKIPPPERAIVPEIEKGRTFSANAGVALLRSLMKLDASLEDARTAHIAFSNVQHLAVDLKTISDGYNQKCNRFLQSLSEPIVITQLLIGKPMVTFKRSDGSNITLEAKHLKTTSSVKGRIDYDIKDNATLVAHEEINFAYKGAAPVRDGVEMYFSQLPSDATAPNYLIAVSGEATISMSEALETAVKVVPGTVFKSELRTLDGRNVYEINLLDPEDKQRRVVVDMQTGKTMKIEK